MTKTTVPLVGRNGTGGVRPASTESVADILQRELDATIHDWIGLVEKEPELSRIALNYQERTGHLPKLLYDVIAGCVSTQGRKPRSRSLQVTTEICDVNKATPSPMS
jgi:hypothetical protein